MENHAPNRAGWATMVPATICSIWQDYRSIGEDRLGAAQEPSVINTGSVPRIEIQVQPSIVS
jgi:hypothetical protein